MDKVKAFAETLANAADRTVVLGVRPRDKGWFVHCDDIEFDVGGVRGQEDMLSALKAIRDHLVAEKRREVAEAAHTRDTLASLEALT